MTILFIIPTGYYDKSINTVISLTILFVLVYATNLLINSSRIKRLVNLRNYGIAICAIAVGYTFPLLANQKSIKADGWTKQQEEVVINQTKVIGKNFGLTDPESQVFATCVLGMYKSKYPQGITGVNQDELRELGRVAGKTCLPRSELSFRWTAASENMIKQYFMESKELGSLSVAQREKFANCVLVKLKQKYPNGLAGKIPEKDANELGAECVQEIK